MLRGRRFLIGVLVVALAGCGGSSVAMLPRGVEGARRAVPWSKVGNGWVLAQWATHERDLGEQPAPTERDTLLLVDPAGRRYAVGSVDPMTSYLAAWSPNMRHALLEGSADRVTTLTDLDLEHGTSRTYRFTTEESAWYSYAPDGVAIWAEQDVLGRGDRWLVTDAGLRPLSLPFPEALPTLGKVGRGRPLYRRDGSVVVVGAARGLGVFDAQGRFERELPIADAAGRSSCVPVRWWAADTVLARCDPKESDLAERLWLAPLDGAPPSRLTGAGQDLPEQRADVDAWALGGKVYVTFGSCGAGAGEVQPNTTVRWLDVDHQHAQTTLFGSDGRALLLAGQDCEGEWGSLFRYDPATGATSYLLGPHANGGAIVEAYLHTDSPG